MLGVYFFQLYFFAQRGFSQQYELPLKINFREKWTQSEGGLFDFSTRSRNFFSNSFKFSCHIFGLLYFKMFFFFLENWFLFNLVCVMCLFNRKYVRDLFYYFWHIKYFFCMKMKKKYFVALDIFECNLKICNIDFKDIRIINMNYFYEMRNRFMYTSKM